VGFTIGVALLVAIFTHTVAQNAQHATRQAMGYVAAQQQLSPAEKGMYSAAILKNAKAAASGGGGAVLTTEPLKGAPKQIVRAPQLLTWQEVNADVAAIYRHDIAESFRWPFYAAALAALLAVPAALFTGRRLGADIGHHEMTREERAADRA